MREEQGTLEVTLSLDTAAYASGDVLADTQKLGDAVMKKAGSGKIESILLIDDDDQAQALDLYFLKSDTSLGTENAAPDITDTEALEIVAVIPIAASDYEDLGGVQVAYIKDLNAPFTCGSSSRALWVAAISKGTGTYTASGIKLKVSVSQKL